MLGSPGNDVADVTVANQIQETRIRIEALEQQQSELEQVTSSPQFYAGDHAEVEQVLAELAAVQLELETTFERWAEPEGE